MIIIKAGQVQNCPKFGRAQPQLVFFSGVILATFAKYSNIEKNVFH